MKNNNLMNQALRKIILPACCIAFLSLMISLTLPLESQVGAASKMEKDSESIIRGLPMEQTKIAPTYIRAKIMNLAVKIDGDQYTCVAALAVENTDIGAKYIIANIPSPRVQRVFELAMAMKNYNEPVLYQRAQIVEAWGYKTPVPKGKETMDAAFYTIAEAKIWDEELCDVVLQPWNHSQF